MNVTNLFDQLHDPYADHDDEVTAKRSELLTHLTYGIRVMEHAAELLDDLRSGAAEDVELVEGRDGRDCAAPRRPGWRHRARPATGRCIRTRR